MVTKNYRDGNYNDFFWDFRGGEFIEDPDEDIDDHLRTRGQDAEDRQDTYDQFLESDYWSKVRATMMIKCNGKCQGCGSAANLQVHHKSYPKRYTELQNLHLLELLCEACHHQTHQRFPTPATRYRRGISPTRRGVPTAGAARRRARPGSGSKSRPIANLNGANHE